MAQSPSNEGGEISRQSRQAKQTPDRESDAAGGVWAGMYQPLFILEGIVSANHILLQLAWRVVACQKDASSKWLVFDLNLAPGSGHTS